MHPLTLNDLQYVHPFYVAATDGDLNEQFEEGKRRAIDVMQRRIDRIKQYTRADYNNCFGVKETTATDDREST